LASFDAHALALGRLNVLSSIGEPLRAEVDILDLTAAEASSLRPSLASEEAYKAMGLDYNPDLSSMQFNLQQMPDGRSVLQLNNSRPVTAAFVDIVLEVSWASGKITRDFTLLLTPPKSAASALPVAPVLPMTAVAGTKRVTVVRGDTAGQLAMQSLPANVSLDQMLLALLRSNPDAFVAGNVNRLKAGAVLALPTAGDASSVSRAEARQTIIAQSRDFNAFRQQLASNARPAQVTTSGREATGKVRSAVQEKTPAAAATDKLTLSKGALKGSGTTAGTGNAEEKLAKERQDKDAADRLAELSKNISDLSRLDAAPAAPTATSGTPTTAAPEPTPAASSAGPALATGALPAVTADMTPPGWIDRLSGHPAVLPAATGFLGLLLAFGLFRSRRHAAAKNRAFKAALDDAEQTDPVASTSEEPSFTPIPTPTPIATPKARQEPLEDDPLTVAQNALLLGREAQAEALLRGALERTPERLALHIELMDMCIERADAAGFETLAIDALTVTGGQGANWERICKKGQALDPTNPLYQSAAANPPPAPPFSKLDFDLELGTAAPDKAPPRAKS
jgi:pilus assembly protein FimV